MRFFESGSYTFFVRQPCLHDMFLFFAQPAKQVSPSTAESVIEKRLLWAISRIFCMTIIIVSMLMKQKMNKATSLLAQFVLYWDMPDAGLKLYLLLSMRLFAVRAHIWSASKSVSVHKSSQWGIEVGLIWTGFNVQTKSTYLCRFQSTLFDTS